MIRIEPVGPKLESKIFDSEREAFTEETLHALSTLGHYTDKIKYVDDQIEFCKSEKKRLRMAYDIMAYNIEQRARVEMEELWKEAENLIDECFYRGEDWKALRWKLTPKSFYDGATVETVEGMKNAKNIAM